jgi:hypothetical protein
MRLRRSLASATLPRKDKIESLLHSVTCAFRNGRSVLACLTDGTHRGDLELAVRIECVGQRPNTCVEQTFSPSCLPWTKGKSRSRLQGLDPRRVTSGPRPYLSPKVLKRAV